MGTAPELIRHYIELRGIGVIDVCRLFGMSAVKDEAEIDMVINLEPWKDGTMYDRLGLENLYTTILAVSYTHLLAGDLHPLALVPPHQCHRLGGGDVADVHRAAGLLRQHGIPGHHQLLGDGRPASQPELAGDTPLVDRVVLHPVSYTHLPPSPAPPDPLW